jgi:hypothetical protein
MSGPLSPAENERTLDRGRLVRNGALAGVGVAFGAVAGAVGSDSAAGATSPGQDRRILRFLLELEYLQAEFYAAAEARGRLRGELREFAEVVGKHEREHVALLRRRLGSAAPTKPAFDFREAVENPKRFARTAQRLEETGVAAYIGQGANLTPRAVVTVAAITAVEARHAAWIADVLGRDPAPHAADKGQTSTWAIAAIRRSGFVKQR